MYLLDKKFNNISIFCYLAIVLALLHSEPSYAADDLQTILTNLKNLINPLLTLLLAVSFAAGLGMIFRGLGLLKAFGMPLTQASKPGEVAGPLVYIIVGAILIYLPTTTNVITKTMLGDDAAVIGEAGGKINLNAVGKASSEILSYAPVSIEAQWADLADTLILYVEFIGFLAFIRGWFIISQAGQPGVQPGSISKGITHVIGGILAVNFVPVVKILHNTIWG